MLKIELAKIKSGFRLISMVIAGLILSSNMGCGEKDDPCEGANNGDYYYDYKFQLINSTGYDLVIRGFKDGSFLEQFVMQKNSKTNISFYYAHYAHGWEDVGNGFFFEPYYGLPDFPYFDSVNIEIVGTQKSLNYNLDSSATVNNILKEENWINNGEVRIGKCKDMQYSYSYEFTEEHILKAK